MFWNLILFFLVSQIPCFPSIDDEYPAQEVLDTYLHWFSSYLECVWLWGHMLDVIRSPPPLSANQRFSFLSSHQWDAWLSDDGGAAISVDINTWGDQGPGVVACGLMVPIWEIRDQELITLSLIVQTRHTHQHNHHRHSEQRSLISPTFVGYEHEQISTSAWL